MYSRGRCLWLAAAACAAFAGQAAADNNELLVPLNRSALVASPLPIAKAEVANPDIADADIHDKHVTVSGKHLGHTSLRMLDRNGKTLREVQVTVGYDLPAIRQALHNFLPDENIGVEMAGSGIALSGQVSSASAADTALKIAKGFIDSAAPDKAPDIVNAMQVASGQQVTLRVRVAEIQRTALKGLGIDSNYVAQTVVNPAVFPLSGALPTDATVFKVLAEPYLVADAGVETDFMAGGEVPVPIVQYSSGGSSVTTQLKPFGVAVKFLPQMLPENRIRMTVQPEVSEVSIGPALSGVNIPSLDMRRAKTTIDLASGESFIIAGIFKGDSAAAVGKLAGVKDLPVLGPLFESPAYQHHDTELVIVVTPTLADSATPSGGVTSATPVEKFFFGAIGSLSGDTHNVSQMPSLLEGPIGFMTD